MLIIRKTKDYYDYVASQLCDENVVFDRRDECLAFTNPSVGDYVGVMRLNYRVLANSHHHDDTFRHVVVELGRVRYLFGVNMTYHHTSYYEYKSAKLDVSLIDKVEIDKRVEESVTRVCIDAKLEIFRYMHTFTYDKTSDAYKTALRTALKNFTFTRDTYNNPILKDTWIPSHINANEAFTNIYEYLCSLRDTPIVDTRTDVQKAESHGFDKKTSFRNIK